MSQAAVEKALGTPITDEGFRRRFFKDPAGTSFAAGQGDRPTVRPVDEGTVPPPVRSLQWASASPPRTIGFKGALFQMMPGNGSRLWQGTIGMIAEGIVRPGEGRKARAFFSEGEYIHSSTTLHVIDRE